MCLGLNYVCPVVVLHLHMESRRYVHLCLSCTKTTGVCCYIQLVGLRRDHNTDTNGGKITARDTKNTEPTHQEIKTVQVEKVSNSHQKLKKQFEFLGPTTVRDGFFF